MAIIILSAILLLLLLLKMNVNGRYLCEDAMLKILEYVGINYYRNLSSISKYLHKLCKDYFINIVFIQIKLRISMLEVIDGKIYGYTGCHASPIYFPYKSSTVTINFKKYVSDFLKKYYDSPSDGLSFKGLNIFWHWFVMGITDKQGKISYIKHYQYDYKEKMIEEDNMLIEDVPVNTDCKHIILTFQDKEKEFHLDKWDVFCEENDNIILHKTKIEKIYKKT